MKTRLMITGVAALALASPAWAGTATGKIKKLYARSSDGLHYVELEVPVTGSPACSAGKAYFMIRNEGSDVGRSQFAMLLSAAASGHPVTIGGTGSCTRWVDGEDIDTVIWSN
jgi:hypothetical protein